MNAIIIIEFQYMPWGYMHKGGKKKGLQNLRKNQNQIAIYKSSWSLIKLLSTTILVENVI